MLRMFPVAAGGLAITYGYLRWAFRGELATPFPERLTTIAIDADRTLVVKGLAMFVLALVGWLAGGSLPLVAIACGAVMVAVFFTFALSGPLPPKEMGVILGIAVLLDTFVVRLLLLPVFLRLADGKVIGEPVPAEPDTNVRRAG